MSFKYIYHLSLNNKLPTTLYPRSGNPNISIEDITEDLFTEHLPDRVSFGLDINKCLIALYPNIHEEFNNRGELDLYVYVAKLTKQTKVISGKELSQELWDYHLTKEVAVLEPIDVTLIGKIKAIIPKGDTRRDGIWTSPFNNKRYSNIYCGPKLQWIEVDHYKKHIPIK